MNINDMNKKPTTDELRNNLVERFNINVDLDEYSFNQLIEMKDKLQRKINNLVENNDYNYTQKNDYQKNRLFLEIIEAELDARRPLIESAEDKAEIVIAGRDMVSRITKWMEETAQMQSESMLELADAIRNEMGAETAQQYQDSVKPALESLYDSLDATRTALTGGVGILTGEGAPAEPMGSPDMDMGAEIEGPGAEDEMPAGDDFGASAAAAGGEEPADRARRESVDLSRRLGMIMSEGYGKKNKKTLRRKKKSY